MKKILEMFGEPITYGGQESVVFNMLSTLDLDDKYNIDLYTPYFADNKKMISLIESHNGKVFHQDIKFKTGDNRFLLYKDVEKFFNSKHYNIVHIHTGSLSTMCLYSYIAKKYGAKVIVHTHIAGEKETFLHVIQKILLCLILKKYVDVYLGCSKKAIDWKWTKDIVSEAKVVCNGIDTEIYKYNSNYRNDIRDKYNIKNKIVIGNVGRITRQKNHKFMIDIINKLPENYILMLVGDGEDKVKISKYINSDKVIFVGEVSDAYKYYSAFDLFIMPSLYEGLPVACIEAQYSGLICLLSEKITNETKITDKLQYLPINYSNLWANTILNIDISGHDRNLSIYSNKYDKKQSFKIIDDIYSGI